MSKPLRLFAGVALALWSARGWAGGVLGVEPDVSTRQQVLTLFGDQAQAVTSDGKGLIAVRRPRQLPAVAQLQFTIAATGLVERIDVFPATQIDAQTIENTYGRACITSNPVKERNCYVRRVSPQMQVFFDYPSLRRMVFFSEGGVFVLQIALYSAIGAQAPAPPTNQTTTASATIPPPTPSPGPAEEKAPAAPAAAEDDGWGAASTFAPVTAPPPSERQIEFGGKVIATAFAPLLPQDPLKQSGRVSVDGLMEARAKTTGASAYASLFARRDFVTPSRDRFDVPEAYAELSSGAFRLLVGRRIVAWGASNLSNPTDILNPVDRVDTLVTEKRGSWMIKGSGVFGPALVEAYYLPVPEPHLLPEVTGFADDGTILSPNPWVVGTVPQDPMFQLRYHLGQTSPPPVRVQNTQGAARVALSVLGADVRAGYAYIFEKYPTIRSTNDLTTLPSYITVVLDFAYQRQHVVTFDFERPFGSLRVAGEAAWFKYAQPRPTDVELSYLTYVVGADYELPPFLTDHRVRVFAEWTQTAAVEGTLLADFIGQLRHPFPRAIMGRATYQAGTAWTAEVSAVVSALQPDYAVLGRVTTSIGGVIKARVGGAYLGGDPGGVFGKFHNNTRLECGVEAAF